MVRFGLIPARDIFNACDPGELWNVAKEYGEEWRRPEYDGLRALLREVFISEFDRLSGHYSALSASIERHGIRDPIVVTAGPPLWREGWQVPNDVDFICESLGGSRLMIADRLGLDVPCIINDRMGLSQFEPLRTAAAVRALFADPKPEVSFGEHCRVRPTGYTHTKAHYTLTEQQKWRRMAKAKQIEAWQKWKKPSMT